MIILVTGGRWYANVANVHRALDAVHTVAPITLLIQGGATGADTHAGGWATSRGVATTAVPVSAAAWAALGLGAGPARNAALLGHALQQGIQQAGAVVAFPGQGGTANMVKRALAAGVRVILVDDDGAMSAPEP